jgi:transposase, IS5 family
MARGAPGFIDIDERLAELSAKGDDLERMKSLVDFEMFRPALEAAVLRADRSKGGRPPFDHVFMFKVLILQAMHCLSDERCEYLIKDRLSFMRFLGLGISDAVPDANTIWTVREALKKASAVDPLFQRFDEALRDAGFLAMSGQIVDATIVATPKQRNTDEEKRAIKEGRVPEDWKEKPTKLARALDDPIRESQANAMILYKGLGDPDGLLMLPLGPNEFLVGFNRGEIDMQKRVSQSGGHFIEAMNQYVVECHQIRLRLR